MSNFKIQFFLLPSFLKHSEAKTVRPWRAWRKRGKKKKERNKLLLFLKKKKKGKSENKERKNERGWNRGSRVHVHRTSLGILPEIFSAIGMLSSIIRIFRKTGTNCSRFRLHISVLFDRLKFHVRFSLAAIQDFDSRRSTSLSVRTNTLACACIYSGVQDGSENGWFRCYQNRDWDGNFLFKASIAIGFVPVRGSWLQYNRSF